MDCRISARPDGIIAGVIASLDPLVTADARGIDEIVIGNNVNLVR
jgi:hypothetical protein